jgi:hypothetical protein
MNELNGLKATLIEQCTYVNGYITIMEGMVEDFETQCAGLVACNLVGWGRANAVVLVDGQHYLAIVD